jgi:hypothetical protein
LSLTASPAPLREAAFAAFKGTALSEYPGFSLRSLRYLREAAFAAFKRTASSPEFGFPPRPSATSAVKRLLTLLRETKKGAGRLLFFGDIKFFR